MQNYTQFTSAYEEEMVSAVPRVSRDIPTNFEEWKSIIRNTPVVVIYMWSNSCRPCHMVRDKYERLATEFQNENVLFFKDNIDLPTSFHRNNVDVVPTFFILCDGHELQHPFHKSVCHGWEDRMPDTIRYHLAQSQIFYNRMEANKQQEYLQQQEQQEQPQRKLYCRNNVCYLYPDDEEGGQP